jgi:hypothetical protein
MNNNIQCSIESSTTKIELNSAVDGVFLVPELDGLAGLPEIRTTSGVNAGYDGGWTSAQNYDARLISIRGVIANPDVAQVEAKRRAIASLLGQGRKEQLTLRFTTEAGNAYVISVRTISCEMALQRVLTTQEFLIQLRADDPLIYDDGASAGTEAILQVQKALGGFEIDFELPLAIGGGAEDTVVENGSETVYPIINLYGPLHSPTVVNRTTNQQMQILADLQYTVTWSGYQNENIGSSGQIDVVEEIAGSPMSLTQLNGNATQDGTPTPDAPIPVEVVTGEQTVRVTGKNLFDYSSASDTANTTVTQYRVFAISGLKPNATYTMSGQTIRQITDTTKFIYLWSADTYSGAERKTSLKSADIVTFGANADGKIYLAIYPTDTATWESIMPYLENAQLEQGSQASDYQPYQGQEFEINLGKNLLPNNMSSQTLNDVIFTVNDDKSITMSGTTTARTEPRIYYTNASDSVLKLKAGTTYYNNMPIVLYLYTTTYRVIQPNGSYTPTADETVTQAYIRIENGETVDTTIYPMLTAGAPSSTYAPYFTPIELAKVGNYQDRIYKDEGKWYIEKQVGKVVLNGSENWSLYPNKTHTFRAGAPHTIVDAISDHFTSIPSSQFDVSAGAYTSNTGIFIISYPDMADVASFKTWLASNPTTFYCAGAQWATTTEITDDTLLSQLNFLASLYEGENNISLIGTGAQGEIVVKHATVKTINQDVAVIDSQARTITLNGQDVYHLKTSESEFLVLAPGENKLYLTSEVSDDSGYAEVKFKQGYLSI